MNQNGTIVEYSVLGNALTTTAAGLSTPGRAYIPGNPGGVVNATGPTIVAYYSTAKFLPGTKIRWEPSVSFTTPGRVYVGFTDNPEVMASIAGLSGSSWGDAVKGLGDVVSFPIWQETEIAFPTRLRRKMFDTNTTATVTDTNSNDRSVQTFMFAYIDGAPASTAVGSFWYHDKVMVEGIQPVLT